MNYRWGRMQASYSVACGKCKQAYEACLGARTKTEAATIAKNSGWVFTRAWGWVCEECEVPAAATKALEAKSWAINNSLRNAKTATKSGTQFLGSSAQRKLRQPQLSVRTAGVRT